MDWRIPDSRSRTPHRRIKNAPIQLKRSPPPQEKMDWRIPDSRSRTPHRRIKNAPIQLKRSPPPQEKMDWRIPDSRSRTPHRRIKNAPIQLKRSPPPTGKNGLAHSRFSLANAAPENQECAHPAEKVPPPQEKMDWRIPDSRSRTPHRRIKNAPIQLKRSPPTGKNGLAHSRFSLANAAPENQECAHPAEKVPPHRKKWIGAFPILARERRTRESRMRPSS